MATQPTLPTARGLQGWLSTAPAAVFTVYAIGASFATYFCMYAFRKPFAAASFAEQKLGPLDLKTALVIGQIVGYTISKYIGIKVCSEIAPARRGAMLVLLILWAEAALLLFALVPAPAQVACMLLNGLPLGMVWGLVVGYLEGRRTSELLLAGLSCSYIVSSAVVKDVGKALIQNWQVSEAWMPAATGALFLPGFLLSVWLLQQIPRPTAEDILARVEREPMDARQRGSFVREFALGLALLFFFYFFLTAYRDFRDNYGIEVLRELGFDRDPAIFSKTETPVALGVMAALAALNVVRDNRRGLMAALAIMLLGALTMGLATLAMDLGLVGSLGWMILVGLGSYLAYVPFGSMLFDRLIASTRVTGTAVFAIYVADAIGYTGSIGVQLYKDLGQAETTRLAFFRLFTYLVSALGTATLLASAGYFWAKSRPGAIARPPAA